MAKIWSAVTIAFALFIGSVAGGDKTADGEARKIKVAVIPKGTTHVFWKSIHAGAVKAGQELACEIVWQGPHKEDDRKTQFEVVQSFNGSLCFAAGQRSLERPVA